MLRPVFSSPARFPVGSRCIAKTYFLVKQCSDGHWYCVIARGRNELVLERFAASLAVDSVYCKPIMREFSREVKSSNRMNMKTRLAGRPLFPFKHLRLHQGFGG